MTQDSLRSLRTDLRKVSIHSKKLRISLVFKASFLGLYNENLENY